MTNHCLPPLPGRLVVSLFTLLIVGLFPPATAAVEATNRRSYDLPADSADKALRRFSEQSGVQVIFPTDVVRGIRANAVQGTLTPGEAIDRMFAGTGLVAVLDAKTGALTVRRETVAPKNVASPAVENDPAAGPPVKMEQVEVTGTRLRGLLAGATAQPVLTFSSAEIDRTGAQSLGDLLRYIPQVSSFTTGQASTLPTRGLLANTVTGVTTQTASASQIDGSAGRTTATLRGAPAGGTLLLIDGRRAPKNNQARGNDGYDLNGIPLAAVDRIEVLLDGASSIYGADAMGGVINVVLKKNYRGAEVRAGYENTFDQDAGVVSTSLTHGFGAGKIRGMVTLTWEKSNTMAMRDRTFTASWDRRPYGGTDLRPAIAGGAGQVSRSGGALLPGLTTSAAAVPPGNSGANLTVADYAAAGAIPGPLDLGLYTNYAAAYWRSAAVLTLDYSYREWLQPYVELRAARNRNTALTQPIQARNLSVPAGYPGNPFGVAVTLSKYFLDLQPERVSNDDTVSALVGLRGQLPRGWGYDFFVGRVQGHTRSDANSGVEITAAALTAAIAAGRAPNLFYDGTRVASPNSAGLIEGLTTVTVDEEKDETWTYQVQANGPIFALPAGAIQAALGVEQREEYTDFPRRLATDTTTARNGSQRVSAVFGELNVPVFGETKRLPLFHQLNLSGSYRRERYSDGGATANPRGGVAWRPVAWLLLRGGYGKGFKVPTLAQRSAPITVSTSSLIPSAATVDPLRGNTANPTTYPITRGGKSDLRPEKSENTTFGLVLEIPRVSGLSLSFDYFDNKFVDRIGTLLFNQMAQFYPERITRGARLPTDPAGWAGVVTAADLRALNSNFSQTTGYDLGVRFDRRFSWGSGQFALSGTNYTRNVFAPTPGLPPSTTVNTDSLPVQINGSGFVVRHAWGVGVLTTYRAANRSSPTVIPTPAAIRWDFQCNYDFTKAAWLEAGRDRWYGRMLANTKASLTIFNALNAEPPLDYYFLPDNTIVDARLRRYAVSLRRQF